MSTVERLEAYCKQREREIDSDTCEQALCVDERAAVQVHELRMLLDTIAALRSATRVRVTAEEPPTGSGYCLAWPAFLNVPVLITADIVRAAHRAYPEWLPLPERPEK